MTLASDAQRIARAGIAAVEPRVAVEHALRRTAQGLRVGGRTLPLGCDDPVVSLAIGKGATRMSEAAHRAVGARIRGLAVIPPVGAAPRGPFEVYRGGHPVPTAGSERAAQAALAFLQENRGGPVLFLISGGGSALCESPSDGISLDDLERCTELFLGAGTPIQGINTVRRHLSRIKGGQLGALVGARPCATLAISDVVGDTPWDIASGPTVPDPTTFGQAIRVARRWKVWSSLPRSIRARLELGRRAKIPETPKPGDARFRGHGFHLIASNRQAVTASARAARQLGYRVHTLPRPVIGDTGPVARAQSRLLRRILREGRPVRPPACVLSGGETTIRLEGHTGHGGRNQEFALTAASAIDGERSLLVLSVGTDGVDGPTDAAGGWVDDRTAARARRLGLDLGRALAAHESYDALSRLGSLWRTGPTGTNVMDLHVLLAAPAARR